MKMWKRKYEYPLPCVTTRVWGQPGALNVSCFWQTLQEPVNEFPQTVSTTRQNKQAPSHHTPLEPRVRALNSNSTLLWANTTNHTTLATNPHCYMCDELNSRRAWTSEEALLSHYPTFQQLRLTQECGLALGLLSVLSQMHWVWQLYRQGWPEHRDLPFSLSNLCIKRLKLTVECWMGIQAGVSTEHLWDGHLPWLCCK